MRFRTLLLPVLLAGVSAGASARQVQDSSLTTGDAWPGLRPFDDAAREILKNSGAPGAALAVTRDGRLVLARGYGYADARTREPVEPASRFRIASVSKPITAVAVLKLAEEGRLSLNESVVETLGFTPSVR